MDLLRIEGVAPGAIVATVIHRGDTRRLSMHVGRHPEGGWRMYRPGGWGPRCHAVSTAVLLDASEVFAEEESVAVPMLQAA